MSALTILRLTPLLLFSLADAVPPPATQSSIDMAAAVHAMTEDIQKKMDEHLAPICKLGETKLDADDCSYMTDFAYNGVSACINNVMYMVQDQLGLSSTGAEPDESVSVYFLSSPGSYLPGTAATGKGRGDQ